MNRRQFVGAVTAGTVSIAGCNDDEGNDDERQYDHDVDIEAQAEQIDGAITTVEEAIGTIATAVPQFDSIAVEVDPVDVDPAQISELLNEADETLAQASNRLDEASQDPEAREQTGRVLIYRRCIEWVEEMNEILEVAVHVQSSWIELMQTWRNIDLDFLSITETWDDHEALQEAIDGPTISVVLYTNARTGTSATFDDDGNLGQEYEIDGLHQLDEWIDVIDIVMSSQGSAVVRGLGEYWWAGYHRPDYDSMRKWMGRATERFEEAVAEYQEAEDQIPNDIPMNSTSIVTQLKHSSNQHERGRTTPRLPRKRIKIR